MKALVLAGVLATLAVSPAAAQRIDTPVIPGCLAFVPEGANGSVTLCFKVPMTETMRAVFDELVERDKVQAERHGRVHEECGDAGQFGSADTAEARGCRARVAHEVPFPTPSDTTVEVLRRYRLSWE